VPSAPSFWLALKRWWFSLSPTAMAIWLTLLDNVGMSIMVTLLKLMGSRYDSNQLAFFRSFVGLMVFLPVLAGYGLAIVRTKRPVMHALRVGFGSGSMLCGFYAVTALPLAESTALNFTRPLVMMVTAVIFLGEIVGWRRWTAALVGFSGVLVMVQPGSAQFDPAMLVSLLGSCLGCGTVVVVKKLSETDTTASLMFSSAVVTTLITAVPAYVVWRTPELADIPVIVIMGLLGTSTQFLFLKAYSLANAAVLAPIDYSRLLFASFLGYAVFGDLPAGATLAGAAIVAASTLYIMRREAMLQRAAATATPAAPPHEPR
jgi:drug/metabolite transporter (DMT)-like permease